MTYNHLSIEKKWQDIWNKERVYEVKKTPEKAKFYVLEMFPYPSGKIHMGHIRNYSIGDVISRYKRAHGFSVLHPIGWDAFGLPAENAAMNYNLHPREWTDKNIYEMRNQLKSIGFSYDWSREINTSKPEYYKYEQLMFIHFFKLGIAYQKESEVNWDPIDKTVLANEQVIDGKGWRSGATIEKKKLRQWFLKITDFADDLLAGLKNLDWPDNVKLMQENWIGKSSGATIDFSVKGVDSVIKVFSTRPETIFGATFVAISYQHEFAKSLNNYSEVKNFFQDSSEDKGYFTGYYVEHPVIDDRILPIYICSYVLADYGTGAIFGCPAHDERDAYFAKRENLQFITIQSEGILCNSGFLNGLSVNEARDKIIKYFISNNIGKKNVMYKMKDWGISRQRYWGAPIPIIYCKKCGIIPVDEGELPIKLPDDIDFTKGGNPLDNHPSWKYVNCHICKNSAVRETDTFDTFIESSWYFLKYCSKDKDFYKEVSNWMSVDIYVGGVEHAILHLLYARFFTKALKKCGYLNIEEPFNTLLTQGMICHKTFQDKDGNWLYPDEVEEQSGSYIKKVDKKEVIVGRLEKMSKSKKNTVDPTYIIESYGADSVRLFTLSDSPPTRDLEWSDQGIKGCYKFLSNIYQMALLNTRGNNSGEDDLKFQKFLNKNIISVSENIDKLLFNKAIANLRELSNSLSTYEISSSLYKKGVNCLLIMLHPFAPHITEELWLHLGNNEYLHNVKWPSIDDRISKDDYYTIAIQLNGKTKRAIEVPMSFGKEEILKHLKELGFMEKYLKDRQIRKIIHVPKRVMNILLI